MDNEQCEVRINAECARLAWSKRPDPDPPVNVAEARSSDASGMMLCRSATDALGPEHYAQFQPPARRVDRHVGAARTTVIRVMMTQTIRCWSTAVFTGPALSDIFTSSNGPGGSEVDTIVTSSDPSMATNILAGENQPNDRPRVDHPEDDESGNPTKPYTKYLTELCELNVSLYNHPLYEDASSDTPQNCTQKSPSASATTILAPSFRLPDLKIGQLLSMTAQLKNLVGNITSIQDRLPTECQDLGTGPMQPTLDRSTALIVLSCYARFNVIYTRTIDALREIRATAQTLGHVDYLMPTLSIDGYDLGLCHDVQLSFAIQLCQRVLYRLRGCMRSCGEELG
ncbi:hypothetical protein FQN50_003996 [Emmonsiellopsis sp. PD_5]|nr:hypothetical protein FQN50_003996 [Emmonsiellopsis sp. PD_5]